jgi:hypothetical protein
VQAIRSHQRAENFPRAATLALRLQTDYADDKASSEYAGSVLGDLSPQYLRVDVTCDQDCKLDLDGKLQEFKSFFVDPAGEHTLVATFESGSKTQKISGEAGGTRAVEFAAPPPPPTPKVKPVGPGPGEGGAEPEEESRKPLPPVVTFIGAGVTGLLLAGTIVSGLDANAGAPDYKKAADAANTQCAKANDAKCKDLYSKAQQLLKDGQSKETRTNILIVATAVAGVSTGIIALLLTDWSSDDSESNENEDDASASVHIGVAPTLDGGALGFVRGRF